ncbi:glycosyltransferase family 2 protein [Pectobacterium cacticida]|uniref:glycosyltransferase family 2 protein n=1 Tax=Pectobacterium cacticida TaxID=69221 RepID=UPI002FF32292
MIVDEKPKIGLVTVLYNGDEALPDFFSSLAKQSYKNFILYVIDNSPETTTIGIAKELSEIYNIPSLFIRNDNNLGVAAGNNIGISLSLRDKCKYTLLLNNDIDFGYDVLERMVSFLKNHDEDIVVPKIYYAGTKKIWMAGGDISLFKGSTTHRGDMEDDIGRYNDIRYVGYAPTCFMIIKNTVFDKTGMMDEKYFVYYDDTDFIFRAKTFGYKICYFPCVSINHKVSLSTGGAESPFSIYYGNRNRFYFIKKNLRGVCKYISLSFFMFTRLIRWFQFNKVQKNSLLKAIKDMWTM